MPKCRQVSAAFLPCSSYQSIMRSRCFASLESSRARTALTARGMFSQKFLIHAITHVYGIYLNEISLTAGRGNRRNRWLWATIDPGSEEETHEARGQVSAGNGGRLRHRPRDRAAVRSRGRLRG